MLTFGDVLRSLREQRGMRQQDLVGSGVSRSLISLYETGRQLPTYRALQVLADRLGVAPDVFFGEHEPVVQESMLALMHQAELAENQERLDEAVDLWHNARMLCVTFGLTVWRTFATLRWGGSLARTGAWQRALDVLLPLFAEGALQHGHPEFYRLSRTIGECYRYLGQPSQARTYFQLAQSTVPQADARWIRMQINVATATAQQGHFEVAADQFRLAEDAAKKMGDGMLEGWAIVGWVTATLDRELTDGCESGLIRVTSLANILQDYSLRIAVLHNRVVLHRLREEWDVVETLLHELKGHKLSDEHEAQILAEVIYLKVARGDWAAAKLALKHALQLPVLGPVRARLLIAAARYYEAQGDDKEREHSLRTAQELLWAAGNHERVE